MKRYRQTAAALIALVCASCATSRNELIPPDSLVKGLAFWEFPPKVRSRPYAFHWYGGTLRQWQRTDSGARENDMTVASCAGLEEALREFEAAIPVGIAIVASQPHPHVPLGVKIHGPTYRVTVFPEEVPGSLTLQGFENQGLPWVTQALEVRELASRCSGG